VGFRVSLLFADDLHLRLGLFACDVGLVADHHHRLFYGTGLDHLAFLIGAADDIVFRRESRGSYANHDASARTYLNMGHLLG